MKIYRRVMNLKYIRKKLIACTLAVSVFLSIITVGNLVTVNAESKSNNIKNNTFWKDTDGNNIYSQGGGIFKFGEKYYWYGVHYKEAETYASNPKPVSVSKPTFVSVTCYSSTDLVNWDFEADVVLPEEVNKAGTATWVGRLGVAKIGEKYAMFVQHEYDDPDNSEDQGDSSSDGVSKQVLVLTSDSPTGSFKWDNRINMVPFTGGTSNTGDQTVFTDDDGKSYLVYSYGRGRGKIFISEIGMTAEGKIGLTDVTMVYQGAGKEGNCMFKYNDKYYLTASDLHGWNTSNVYYLVSDDVRGPYLPTNDMQVMNGSEKDYGHVTQTGFYYTVKGTEQDTVLYCGDRWSDFCGNGIGYNQWCPISFDENNNPYFNSLSSWYLDDDTGTWSIAEDNNYALNGSFEADRIEVSKLVGWDNNGDDLGIINKDKSGVTGRHCLNLYSAEDYKFKLSQDLTVPNGTYTMTAKGYGSSSKNFKLYAQSGGNTLETNFKRSSSFSEITIENIVVKDGKIEIGVLADAAGGDWLRADDITLVKNPAKLENIEFIEPTKKEYKLGEELDLTGGKLLLTYDDGAVKEIELKNSMVSGYDKEKVGKQTVTITFNEVEYTYDIEVIKEDIPPMVEPSTPETSNPTDTSQNLTDSNNKSVKTGDNKNIIGYIILGVSTISVLGFLGLSKKRAVK